MIVAMALLLAPTLAAAAPGQRWSGAGSRGHANHGWSGSRWNHGSVHGRGHWHGFGWGLGGFALGVGVGTLLTAPWWVYTAPAYPAYPVYAPYPAYPVYPGYPAYPAAYPSYAVPYPAPPPPPPPGGSQETPQEPLGSAVPGSLAPPAGLSSSGPQAPQDSSSVGPAPLSSGAASAPLPPAGCEAVTVAGHWEMRVYSDGQRLTVWVPTSTRSVCR